jgi:hypothetical protein
MINILKCVCNCKNALLGKQGLRFYYGRTFILFFAMTGGTQDTSLRKTAVFRPRQETRNRQYRRKVTFAYIYIYIYLITAFLNTKQK